MKSIISHLILNNLKYKYYILKNYDSKRIGYLIILTNHNLRDDLNINLFK